MKASIVKFLELTLLILLLSFTSFALTPITGATSICVGSSIALSDTSAGGSWSSSNSFIATINSAGAVTGVSAGAVTITYTVGASYVTTAFTVNPVPAYISGSTTSICVGIPSTLTDASTGGTWSSSSPVATIIPGGIITGITPGVSVISYTLPTGCVTTININVLSTPSAVTGSSAICPGGTITLSDSTAAGTWSSSGAAIATVGATSGIVTGISPGTTTIHYTVSSGCYAAITVTVNAIDPPIVVHPPICIGTPSLPLTDAITGGTWHSTSPIAIIDSVSGIVTGTGVGTAMVSYTIAPGCSLTSIITINPSPAIITGSMNICTGQTAMLADAAPGGGTWSSGNTSIAVIGSTTGNVSGAGVGTATISFTTAATGCVAHTTVTVNPSPTPITATTPGICSGATTTLTDSTAGGVWSSSATSVAVIGTSSGVITTGPAIGSTTISYTIPTGCRATTNFGVYALPPVESLAGGGNYCPSGMGVNISLIGSTAGVNYQLYNGAAAVASAPGTGAALSFGNQTMTGAYTAIAVNISTGCTIPMAGSPVISIDPLPSVYTVTGGGSFCAGGTGADISLSGSDTGIRYTLYNGPSSAGSSDSGTGYAINLGLHTVAGTYTVIATNPYTGCISNMSGSAVIISNPAPVVYTVTGGGSYCATTAPGLAIGLSSSSAGITYQLLNGSIAVGPAIAGTGSSIDFGLLAATGSYWVVATNTATGCTSNMAGTRTITVVPPPTVDSVTGGGTFCSGSTGSHIGLSGSEAGENYRLYDNSILTGSLTGTGSPIDFGLHTSAGTYKIVASDPTGTCNINMYDSAVIVVHASPSIYAIGGGGGYCLGGPGVSVSLDGSNSGITYQLYTNGSSAGSPMPGSGSSLNFGDQTDTGTYKVVATNATTGCTDTMAGYVTVNFDALPTYYTVTTATGSGAYCYGDLTGIAINVSGSEAGISYQLYHAGTTVGSPLSGSGGPFAFPDQTATGTYIVVAKNLTTTCTDTMPGSVTISINPLPIVYSVTPATASHCAGSAGVPISLAGSEAGINYQLYNGSVTAGSPVPGTGSAIILGPGISGTFTVVATNAATLCSSNMSGSATVTITPTVTPSDSIHASPGDTICPGTSVTFTTIPVNGGATPSFQWYVNGLAAISGSSFSYVPATGDFVSVIMTSSAPCPSPATATSTTTMYVIPLPPISGATSICEGSSITLSDTAGGGAWTSSNPLVAAIATVGASTGVVITSSPGTSVMTYTLGMGCSVSTTVTVNPTPSVSASLATATCGGTDQMTASGAISYSWSPATGLSCDSCAVTLFTPTATTTYVVTGTNGIGCSDTASITADGNRISGYISYTPLSATDSFKVWLIQFNPADSTLIGLDSTFSCLASGTPYYEFDDMPNGSYMVKAELFHQIPGASGYIPTYSNSTPYWDYAASVVHTGAADTLHIAMVPTGTIPPGPGFISGSVVSGAGKGTSGDAPAQGMLVLLLDGITNTPLNYTYTDNTGNYSFSGIATGNYIIYPESFSYFTTPSPVIMLGSPSDSAININFKQYTTSYRILPLNPTGISSITAGNGGILVYPNPTTGDLNIQWNSQQTGDAAIMITDVTGREVYKSTIDVKAATSQIGLGDLKDGIYLITILSDNVHYTSKLVIER